MGLERCSLKTGYGQSVQRIKYFEGVIFVYPKVVRMVPIVANLVLRSHWFVSGSGLGMPPASKEESNTSASMISRLAQVLTGQEMKDIIIKFIQINMEIFDA